MDHRYLFGPIAALVADQRLSRARRSGACLAFGPGPGVDHVVSTADTWETIRARLPQGWQPDFLALTFPGAGAPPAWVWSTPLPIVALVTGWSLQWHYYRRRLAGCDLILTDPAGAEAFTQAGLHPARAANLCGCDRAFVEKRWPRGPRDLDILYVSNLPRAATREHLPWLARLARLGLRWKVGIHTSVQGAEYLRLLSRARIVFNRGLYGEANFRAFEAAAAGALLFQEASNREVPACFEDRRECVLYDADNLERLLHYYLDQEEERCRLVRAAQARVQRFTFEMLWEQHLGLIEREWPALVESAQRRGAQCPEVAAAMQVGTGCSLVMDGGKARAQCGHLTLSAAQVAGVSEVMATTHVATGREGSGRVLASQPESTLSPHPNAPPQGGREMVRELLGRCWQALTNGPQSDPGLEADVQAAVRVMEVAPGDALPSPPTPLPQGARGANVAVLHNALGTVAWQKAMAQGKAPELAEAALRHFRQSVELDPYHVVAGLNLAETLAELGQKEAALAQARQTLARLEEPQRINSLVWESGHRAAGYDLFRVEWERAAWQHAGSPEQEVQIKRALVRWRLRTLLGQGTGELAHWYEAVLARPDLSFSRAALGAALVGAHQPLEAVTHLQAALAADPCDRLAGRSLFRALGLLGDQEAQQRLAEDFCLLSLAAPTLVPSETWFEGALGRVGRISNPSGRIGNPSYMMRPTGQNTVGHSLRECPPDSRSESATISRKRVSLTMIVKNEEAHLPQCLRTVRDLVDEIVIADTGSTDRTREIATQYGARVIDFPWVDHFAAARNAALEAATGDWVWWLDADDSLDETNRQRARLLFSRLGEEKDAYAMGVRSVLNAAGTSARLLEQVRLFPNHPETRWRYRVHEQIMPAVNRRGGGLRWSDVVIDHSGYQDPTLRRGKLARNFRLLELERQENPDDPYLLFNLGWTSLDLGHTEAALTHLRRSLELASPTSSIVRKLYVLLTQANRRLRDTEQAIRYCREGRQRFANDPELLFEDALLLRSEGDLPGAERCLLQLQRARVERCLSSVDAGLRGYKTAQLLGDICWLQERAAESETHWRTALAERPDFGPALAALGRLCLAQERWSELERWAAEMDKEPTSQLDAAFLRARGQLARQDFAAARTILEAAAACHKREPALWLLLSQALFHEGRDWPAAERALEQVLTLAPDHACARRNLAILRSKQRSAVSQRSEIRDQRSEVRALLTSDF